MIWIKIFLLHLSTFWIRNRPNSYKNMVLIRELKLDTTFQYFLFYATKGHPSFLIKPLRTY